MKEQKEYCWRSQNSDFDGQNKRKSSCLRDGTMEVKENRSSHASDAELDDGMNSPGQYKSREEDNASDKKKKLPLENDVIGTYECTSPKCEDRAHVKPFGGVSCSDVQNSRKTKAVCLYYAKGWCIKGDSCKLLHQKDGLVDAGVMERHSSVHYGEEIPIHKQKETMSSLDQIEVPSLSAPNLRSSADSLRNRALVQAYGQTHEEHTPEDDQHNLPREKSLSKPYRVGSYYSWQPSVPFRPSFISTVSSLFSSGKEYNPFTDGIESSHGTEAGIGKFSTSTESGLVENKWNLTSDVGSLFSRSITPELDTGGGLHISPQNGNKSNNLDLLETQQSLHRSENGLERSRSGDSVSQNEPQSNTQIADFRTHVEMAGNVVQPNDGEKSEKEANACKHFRAALIDFVKELVKPAWKEGKLNKDAHNNIVKRTVEKVISGLQSRQIPDSSEDIQQFLSLAHPKILKVVEGYIDKYKKQRDVECTSVR